MKTPLAWLNLTHQKKRTFVAVAGVGFAALLVFMQLGFYGAAESTATIIYDQLDFDILLLSRSTSTSTGPATSRRPASSRRWPSRAWPTRCR